MKKSILILSILTSFVFAKEYSSVTYAKVTHSEPIYEYETTYKPQKRYEYRNHRRDDSYRTSNNEIGLDTVIGATLGVAIGNQIGKGNGRTAAKIAGALIGASIANNSRYERENSYNSRYSNYEVDYESEYAQNDVYEERVLVGYKNYFHYDNERHFKISNRPLHRVKITKTIDF